MDAIRSASLLARLAELEQDDACLEAASARVAEVALRADAVRARAAEVEALLAAVPHERIRLDEAERAARRRAADARGELDELRDRLEALERSRRPRADQREQTLRELSDAQHALDTIDAQLGSIAERRTALETDETVLRTEADSLVVAARVVADEIDEIDGVSDSGRGAPGATLAALDDWGARARAALFVVRGSLDSRRERVVAEANVLAAAVLVDPYASMSVGEVRRRLEAALH